MANFQNKGCRAITKLGKECQCQSTIDGYCIKHWFKVIEHKEDEPEIPI